MAAVFVLIATVLFALGVRKHRKVDDAQSIAKQEDEDLIDRP